MLRPAWWAGRVYREYSAGLDGRREDRRRGRQRAQEPQPI